jgi:methylase of polypeptide subunit release factors
VHRLLPTIICQMHASQHRQQLFEQSEEVLLNLQCAKLDKFFQQTLHADTPGYVMMK